MNLKESNEYLDSLPMFTGSGDFTLNPIAGLLRKCGDPHMRLPPTVHVTGTNGKGSVVAYTSHMMNSCGLRCAAFVSPVPPPGYHESLLLNCNVIPTDIYCIAVSHVKEALEGNTEPDSTPLPHHYDELLRVNALTSIEDTPPPSQFEVLTAVAFKAVELLYSKGQIDCFILEVGLGGRLDSTNIVPPPTVCVLTSISLDHIGILGKTERDIATEKSGIIKSGSQLVVFSENQNKDAKEVIKQISNERNVSFEEVGEIQVEGQTFPVTENLGIAERVVRVIADSRITTTEQLATPQLLKEISTSVMTQGRLESYSLPCEPKGEGFIILDGAHNPAAVQSLCDSLEKLVSSGRVSQLVLMLALLSDKDIPSLIKSYASLANKVQTVFIPTAVESKRAFSHSDFTDKLVAAGISKSNIHSFPTISAAAKLAKTSVGPRTALVVSGSFYLLRTARQLLCHGDNPLERVQL